MEARNDSLNVSSISRYHYGNLLHTVLNNLILIATRHLHSNFAIQDLKTNHFC